MCKILVVDDDQDILELMEEVINHFGYDVVTAGNGIEGLKKYKNEKFEMVFTDIYMPCMDGIDFLLELKKYDEDAVVIILTGYPSEETIQETILNNAHSYFKKPLGFLEIKSLIEKIINVKNKS